MSQKLMRTETYPADWRDAATAMDLSIAVATLESAAESAREAGRPVTAEALMNEARDVEMQRRKLIDTANAARDRVPHQVDDFGFGVTPR